MAYLPLLLLADPSERMIAAYLSEADMFALREDEQCRGVMVITRYDDAAREIKNLAVAPDVQRRGYGRLLLRHAAQHYASAARLLVGTSESGVPFYTACGFRYSHTVRNFFTDRYDEPIYENGVRCVDMIYLQQNIYGAVAYFTSTTSSQCRIRVPLGATEASCMAQPLHPVMMSRQ